MATPDDPNHALAEALRGAECMCTDPELSWVVAPQLFTMLYGGSVTNEVPLTSAYARAMGRALRQRYGPRLLSVGKTAFITTSVQHRRVLDPVAKRLAGEMGQAPAQMHLPSITFRQFRHASRRAHELAWRIEQFARGAFPERTMSVYPLILNAAVLLERAQLAARLGKLPSSLVVSTQHNSAERAILRAAWKFGLHSTYVPHAPVANRPEYSDIPTALAFLRGPSELEWYRDFGAHGRIEVSGDPSLPQIDQLAPLKNVVVYAASPHDPEVLREDVHLLEASQVGPITLCQHPRMALDRRYRSLFPEHWTRSEALTTADYLQLCGARVVVQHDSGVGLDALRAGVPVIDIRAPERRANYPYLENSMIRTAASSTELRRHCALLRSEKDQGALRNFALSWSAHSSLEAVERIVNGLISLPNSIPRTPILDGWRIKHE